MNMNKYSETGDLSQVEVVKIRLLFLAKEFIWLNSLFQHFFENNNE